MLSHDINKFFQDIRNPLIELIAHYKIRNKKV